MYARILYFLLACGFCFISTEITAQKKALGTPKIYLRPESPYEGTLVDQRFFQPSAWVNKDRKLAWRVIIDRTGVMARAAPNEGATTLNSLKFKEGYYVDDTEENGTWLHLVDARMDDLKISSGYREIGWVRANEVMLWQKSLINQRTKIPLKALLINRLANVNRIPCDDKELVRIYQDPRSNVLAQSNTIYNFFFIYKKENGRYLLGSSPGLSRLSGDDELLGWVSEDRMAEWNTRVALEPNFEEPAFAERAANENFRVNGYPSQFQAEDHANLGKPPASALWKGDPVKASPNELSKSDSRRFNADLMRYPLLSVGKGEGILDYHRSAVCDSVLLKKGCDANGFLIMEKVSPIMAAKQREFIEDHQKASTNYNIFFVIEASSGMANYKEPIAQWATSIKKSIDQLQDKPNVRFGALAYGDLTSSSNPDDLIDYENLTSSLSTFQSFVRGIEFAPGTTNEAYPVQNYGISQALNIAKFNPYHTNIMIVLGEKGDFTYSKIKVKTNKNPILIPDKSTLTDAINKYQVNLFGIQCVGGQLMGDKAFATTMVGILQDAANKNYGLRGMRDRFDPKIRRLLEESGYKFDPPVLINPREANAPLSIPLENASLQGGVDRILENGARRSTEDLEAKLDKYTMGIVEASFEFSKEIEEWKTNKLGNGRYYPKLAQIAGAYVGISDASVDWTNEKYELYQEVYFAKQPKNAAYPTFSYVLFWTEEGLKEYYKNLRGSLNTIGNAPRDERREELQNLYCSLIEEFTGNNGRKCEDYTIEEVERTIQGVENEGVVFSGNKKEKLGDLLDKKKVSEIRIDQIIEELTIVRDRLGKLVKDRSDEFVFERNGTRFYWIKSTDLYF